MGKTIDSFHGHHRFLSNFWVHEIEFEGKKYASTEHAFQAAKTLDEGERKKVRDARSCGHAKKIGQDVTLRSDWESVKIDVMRTVLREKFKDPMLRQMLLDTGKTKLIEGNTWGDTFWGTCRGKGKNWLGKCLMHIRQEISDANDGLVNEILRMQSPEEKLKRIREVIYPVAQRFYNDAPSEIMVPKRELAALYVLCINNKNWE